MSLKDKMVQYGVSLGQRCSRRQKQDFLQHMKKEFEQQNISYRIQTKQSSILSVNNIIVHDPNTAKTIIAAGYDTPLKLMIPHCYWYPFQSSKNKREDVFNLLAETILFIALLTVIVFLFSKLGSVTGPLRVLILGISLFLAWLVYHFSIGRPNRINFSMNSAAVAMMLDMIFENKEDQNTAYIFLDECVTSLEGAKVLQEIVPNTSSIIFLNGIACGRLKYAVYGKDSEQVDNLTDQLKDYSKYKLHEAQLKQCVLGVYPESVMLINGERMQNDFVLHGARTAKDTDVDMNSLQAVEMGLQKYIQQQ